MESLAFGGSKLPGADEAVRIGITTPDAAEVEKVIRISGKMRKAVERLERQLDGVLKKAEGTHSNDAVLAAIARVAGRRLK